MIFPKEETETTFFDDETFEKQDEVENDAIVQAKPSAIIIFAASL